MAMVGVIQRMVRDRGFGFIRPDGTTGKSDHFFHRSGMAEEEMLAFDQLAEGQKVSFEVQPSPKGPRAQNIRRV